MKTGDGHVQLKVDVIRKIDMDLVEVEGELDIATVAQLEALSYLDAPTLVLDLRKVTFIDSTGLNTLLDMRARFDGDDRVRLVVRRPGPVIRLLEMTGLADRFVIDQVGITA